MAELDHQMAEPGFFEDPDAAEKVTRARAAAARAVEQDEGYLSDIDDCETLIELQSEGEDIGEQLVETLAELVGRLTQHEVQVLLSGPHDKADAIVAIHPGAGASMLKTGRRSSSACTRVGASGAAT